VKDLPRIETDIAVIGAGAAGLACAWDAAKNGRSVTIIGLGTSATEMSSGCIRFSGGHENKEYGYHAAERFLKEDLSRLEMMGSSGTDVRLYQGHGTEITENIVPRINFEGRTERADKSCVGVIGLNGQTCFDARLFSEMLSRNDIGVERRSLDLTDTDVRNMDISEAVDLFSAEGEKMSADLVFVPPFLKLKDLAEGWASLEKKTGRKFAEPVVDLSLPGARLREAMSSAATSAGAAYTEGASMTGMSIKDGVLDRVTIRSGHRKREIECKAAVFCGGGIVGGGLGISGRDIVDPLGIFTIQYSDHDDAIKRACSAGIVTDGLAAIVAGRKVMNLLVCGASLPGMNIAAGNGIGDAVATAMNASRLAREAAR